MSKKAKIAWLYLVAALFVAVALYLLVNKNNYLFFAVPVVLGILLLYVFSLDKVMLLISLTVPLSVPSCPGQGCRLARSLSSYDLSQVEYT